MVDEWFGRGGHPIVRQLDYATAQRVVEARDAGRTGADELEAARTRTDPTRRRRGSGDGREVGAPVGRLAVAFGDAPTPIRGWRRAPRSGETVVRYG